MNRKAAVVTISDSVSAGKREDASGPAVRRCLEQLDWSVETSVVPDDAERIGALLQSLADSGRVSAILTTGGTGVGPRDVTPEATRAILHREIPGLAEWMRSEGRRFTPRSILSRGIAGTRGRVLIVNLPGSPSGAVQSLQSIGGLLPHIVDLLEGKTEHPPEGETAPAMRASEL